MLLLTFFFLKKKRETIEPIALIYIQKIVSSAKILYTCKANFTIFRLARLDV